MSSSFILFLIALRLNFAAKKCDTYVVGRVWEHKSAAGDDSAAGAFQGCKKGCFWNNTYTDNGHRKCEKCSDVTDEINCTNNEATCLWKKGKCVSQNCPQIAKTRNTGTFIVNNNEAQVSKGRARQLKECIEGSALEQEYNNRYFEDYKKNRNFEYYQDNCPQRDNPFYQVDTCNYPCSAPLEATANGNDNKNKCEARFGGCVYVSAFQIYNPAYDPTNPIVPQYIDDHERDRCVYPCRNFQPNTTVPTNPDDPNPNIALCANYGNAITKCSLNPGYNQNNDQCVVVPSSSGDEPGVACTPWIPGTNNRQHCLRLGCTYIGDDTGDGLYLSTTDKCLVRNNGQCLGFIAGSATLGTEEKCKELGCTFTKYGGADPVGCGSFQTTCVGSTPPSIACHTNQSLQLEAYNTRLQAIPAKVCDDRLYPNGAQTTCRSLYDITRQKCIWDYDKLLSDTTHVNGLDDNGDYKDDYLKPATKYEACMEDQATIKDPFLTQTVLNTSTGLQVAKSVAISTANRRILYGFSTPKEYCDHQRDEQLQQCQTEYETSLNTCYGAAANLVVPVDTLQRNHLQTKAARAACHQIYGCMYSKINERCSVWAVWAFILTIVLVVVVVAGVGAGAVVGLVLKK